MSSFGLVSSPNLPPPSSPARARQRRLNHGGSAGCQCVVCHPEVMGVELGGGGGQRTSFFFPEQTRHVAEIGVATGGLIHNSSS